MACRIEETMGGAGMPGSFLRCNAQRPVKNLYYSGLSGTMLRRPMRTRGESAKSLLDLISARGIGFTVSPILIFTRGFLGSLASTEATDAVPTERSEEHTSELQSHVNLVCRL